MHCTPQHVPVIAPIVSAVPHAVPEKLCYAQACSYARYANGEMTGLQKPVYSECAGMMQHLRLQFDAF